MLAPKKILVAPLHWGLGHATRCIPLINELIQRNFEVIIGSDGGALDLLQKEFPHLKSFEFPSYNITYPKKGGLFKLNMLIKLPRLRKVISAEKKLTNSIAHSEGIAGIISDNRLGVRVDKIPSVIITHQLNVLSGYTSIMSSKLHQNIIKNFDECWVPDLPDHHNLSGKLGHLNNTKISVKYIGLLSRMKKTDLPIKYDILALLSGPEPQRSMLEEILIEELQKTEKRVLLIQGKVESEITRRTIGNLEIVNFLTTSGLERAMNESDIVISRSGYTSIMDLAALEKKAYFIPTPGQYEQLYLAKRLKHKGIVPYSLQHKFRPEKLNEVPIYSGLSQPEFHVNFDDLFRLFESK